MKKIYILLIVLIALGLGLRAQTVVVPANLDGTAAFPFTFISDYITGDTLPNGTQKNKVYQLIRGATYAFTSQVTWRSDITLEATGPVADGRPLVFRINKTGGTSLDPLYRGFGSLKFDGLYVVQGDEGPTAAAYETNPMIGFGEGKTYHFKDCVLEKNRQAIFRIEANKSKAIVEGCHIYNLGDYGIFQGNGRIVDPRNSNMDTVIIRNNVIHNILDRLFIGFRQTGLGYLAITNNTVFNHVGRHGLIQVGKDTKSTLIRDNIFINPSMMGTSTSLANEQLNPDLNKEIFLFQSDSSNVNNKLVMSNNNIYYTPDVLNHYATSTLIKKPGILNSVIAKQVNEATAYFTEAITLNNVPIRDSVLAYARISVITQSAAPNMMVEDISLKGSAYDNGKVLFDFSKFNACYSTTSKSYTGASDGKALGARWACGLVLNTPATSFNPYLNLESFPNPASQSTTFKFLNPKAGNVSITLVDYSGREVKKLFDGTMSEGQNEFIWSNVSTVTPGVYFGILQTEGGRMFTRMIIQ